MSEAVKKTKRTVGKPFKKGQSGNPYGRPKLTEEQKAMRLTSRTQFKTMLAEYSTLTLAEIKKHLAEKKLPIIDMAVMKHLEIAIESGSMDRIDWTTDHIVGKPREETNINLKGSVESTTSIDLKKLSKHDLLALKEIAEKSSGKS